MYNKKWTNYKTSNKGNNAFYNYFDDIDTAGDKTRDAYNKGIQDGTKKAEQLGIPEEKKEKYIENYTKAELSADNDMELYNNAAINMAKIEVEAKNPDPVSKKETEKLATLDSQDIPMSEYIEAKDQNDHKKGTYTTTKYASPVYDENVKNIQHTLNEKGVTDKFSEELEEDGLWGAQTYAAVKKALESDDVDEETKSAIESVWSEDQYPMNLNKAIKDSVPIDFVDKDSYAQKTFLRKAAEKADDIPFKQKNPKYRLETNIRDNNNNKNVLTLVNTQYGEGKNVSKRVLKVEYKNNTDQYHYSIDKNNIDMKDRKNLAKSLNLTDVETEELLSSKKGLMHVYKPKEEGDKIVDFLKNGKKASKILGVVGDSFTVIDEVVDVAEAFNAVYKLGKDYSDDEKVEKETFNETADYAATKVASSVGSAVGAKIGAAIGTAAFGIVGTVVGGFIGSVVGNAIGAVVGGKAADALTEVFYN